MWALSSRGNEKGLSGRGTKNTFFVASLSILYYIKTFDNGMLTRVEDLLYFSTDLPLEFRFVPVKKWIQVGFYEKEKTYPTL